MTRELDSAAAHGGRPYATVRIEAEDQLGPGGAPHQYMLAWDNEDSDSGKPFTEQVLLRFQNGGIQEVGINGITHEALLAIVIDRLQHFQKGPYPNHYNKGALMHLEMALEYLNERTRERAARGVEGKVQA